MESHIKIKATVPEMKDFFDTDGGVRFMEIKGKRFDEAALNRMPESQYNSERYVWDVIYRHKELDKPLTGTFTIKGLLKKFETAKEATGMNAVPLYKYPASYAREHGELEQYRASHKANIACRDAIDGAIRDNYRDNCLGSDTAKQVIAEFGFDRTLYVLANTVREKEWDGRIDQRSKDWARTIPIFDDNDGFGGNRNREFVVDQSHPGLVDLFVKQARREYLLSQPLTKEDIKAEALNILSQFQDTLEPNSPEGTYFMAKVSPDFLARASSEDQARLMKELPFPSLFLSILKDRAGVFAFISQDEDRFHPPRRGRASVRDKLQKAPDDLKPAKLDKKKEQER